MPNEFQEDLFDHDQYRFLHLQKVQDIFNLTSPHMSFWSLEIDKRSFWLNHPMEVSYICPDHDDPPKTPRPLPVRRANTRAQCCHQTSALRPPTHRCATGLWCVAATTRTDGAAAAAAAAAAQRTRGG